MDGLEDPLRTPIRGNKNIVLEDEVTFPCVPQSEGLPIASLFTLLFTYELPDDLQEGVLWSLCFQLLWTLPDGLDAGSVVGILPSFCSHEWEDPIHSVSSSPVL